MIEIKFFGGNSFSLESSKDKIVVNPNREAFGAKSLVVDDKIQLITNSGLAQAGQSRLVIDTAGEYEIGNTSIKGVAVESFADSQSSIAYAIEIDDLKVAVLGDIKSELTNAQLEGLGVVDVLILPVGGNQITLSPKAAAKIARQIDPKIILPASFKNKYQDDLEEVTVFADQMGNKSEDAKSLKIKSYKDLPESLKIIKLETN